MTLRRNFVIFIIVIYLLLCDTQNTTFSTTQEKALQSQEPPTDDTITDNEQSGNGPKPSLTPGFPPSRPGSPRPTPDHPSPMKTTDHFATTTTDGSGTEPTQSIPGDVIKVERSDDQDIYTTSNCSECECGYQKYYVTDLFMDSGCYDSNEINIGYQNRLIYMKGYLNEIYLISTPVFSYHVLLFPMVTPKHCEIVLINEIYYKYLIPMTKYKFGMKFLVKTNEYVINFQGKVGGTIDPAGELIQIDIECENQLYYLLLRIEGTKTYTFDTTADSGYIPPYLTTTTTTSTKTSTKTTTKKHPSTVFTTTTTKTPTSSGLSDNAKIGIIIGGSAGFSVILIVIIVLTCKRCSKPKNDRYKNSNSKRKNAENKYATHSSNPNYPKIRPELHKSEVLTPGKQIFRTPYNIPLPPTPRSARPMTGPLSLAEQESVYIDPVSANYLVKNDQFQFVPQDMYVTFDNNKYEPDEFQNYEKLTDLRNTIYAPLGNETQANIQSNNNNQGIQSNNNAQGNQSNDYAPLGSQNRNIYE